MTDKQQNVSFVFSMFSGAMFGLWQQNVFAGLWMAMINLVAFMVFCR